MAQQNSINNQIGPRKAGCTYVYTGTDGSNVGYFDDVDGKWVYLTLDSFRTIGNASSNAHIAASWAQSLFELFWTQYDNTRCPVLSSSGSSVSRGASATADFNANRRITIPDFRGRVFVGAGAGSGLTARTKGTVSGIDSPLLSLGQLLNTTYGLASEHFVISAGAR